ncbi:MAG TPA: ribosomal protein S18-alanine N-acetyltransferase [Allosphingosinicella sp.]|uniref:ribosomal protein S18-alanine N-acetyltransferase n=1 Tax=Allosphingosinicella sp. TaxID=2823234 RepID=UPI002EDA45DC
MTSEAAIVVAGGDILDLDAVMRVMDDSFDPAYGEAWTASQCAGLLPMPGVWLTLARNGEAVAGFALGRIVVKEAELLLLAVKKEEWGKGIGKLLLRTFAEDAQSKGATKLFLEVRDGNPAIDLYKSFGFHEIGRRPKYYTGRDGQLYDALTLSKLAGA